jgi:SAM-dependent methyltransferase
MTTRTIRTTTNASSCCADDCCGGAAVAPSAAPGAEAVRDAVRAHYAETARGERAGCCGSSPCGGPGAGGADALAAALGYAAQDLESIPDAANMGLSCGNPTALASLKRGETVLDLGSGGGFDCFVAGPKVGTTGRVIGVDMTPDMLARARRNLEQYRARTDLDNVEFRLGEIEHLPVADASVDVVISNCVINLSPDKAQVWREIARVLRPGGRVAVSDLALLRPLPEAIRRDVEALVGCIAGAVSPDETRRMAEGAGLTQIVLAPRPAHLGAMLGPDDALRRRFAAAAPHRLAPDDFVTSLDVSARKGI